MTKPPNRSAQRERTRSAILDGARKLMAEGKPVTVTAAGAVNGVSKATSYRYFPDPNVLIAEAALDVAVASYETVVAGATDLRGKLRAICVYFLDLSLQNEAAFRGFLSAWLAAWDPDKPNDQIKRGGRRIIMFRRALSEHDTGLSEAESERLVQALTVATGIESMVALLDIAGASHTEARDTVAFMAETLVARALSMGVE